MADVEVEEEVEGDWGRDWGCASALCCRLSTSILRALDAMRMLDAAKDDHDRILKKGQKGV